MECKVWSAKWGSKVWSVKFGVESVECGLSSVSVKGGMCGM